MGDSDADGDALTRVLVDSSGNQLGTTVATAHGTVVLNPDYSFSYAPNPGYTGPDSFEYEAFDGAEYSTIATVNIRVTGDPPDLITTGSLSFDVVHDRPLTVDAAEGVVANGSDLNGAVLQATLDTPPNDGRVSITSNGGFTYTPSPGFVGMDQFTYTLSGDGASAIGSVVLNVYDTMPTAPELTYNVGSSGTITVGAGEGILAYAYDADGDALSIVGNSNFGFPITVNADGSFTAQLFDPDTDTGSAQASFQYLVSDGIMENGGQVDLIENDQYTGTNLNGPPVQAPLPDPRNPPNETYQVEAGQALNVTLDSLASPLLPNSDRVSGLSILQTGALYQVNGDPTTDFGSLSSNSDGTFSYTAPPESGVFAVAFAEQNAAGQLGAPAVATFTVAAPQVTKVTFTGTDGIHNVVSDQNVPYQSEWQYGSGVGPSAMGDPRAIAP